MRYSRGDNNHPDRLKQGDGNDSPLEINVSLSFSSLPPRTKTPEDIELHINDIMSLPCLLAMVMCLMAVMDPPRAHAPPAVEKSVIDRQPLRFSIWKGTSALEFEYT